MQLTNILNKRRNRFCIATCIHTNTGTSVGKPVLTNQMATIGNVPSWIDRLSDFRHRARFSSHRATEGIAKYIIYGIGTCVGVMGIMAMVGTIYEQYYGFKLRPKKKMKPYKFYEHKDL